jgi:hypothetical protein
MAAVEGMPVEQLRAYIRALKPEARNLLMAEFERAILRGEEVPAASFVLQELRNEVRGVNAKLDRIGNPQRLFYQPLEQFLINEPPGRDYCGRIPRGCLTPIWQLITRDLLPTEAKTFSAHVSKALLGYDRAALDPAIRAFQDRAVQEIDTAIAGIEDDDKARRRLAGQISVTGGLLHLRQVAAVLRGRDTLALIASQLPATIKNLADESLVSTKKMLDAVVLDPSVFIYAMIVVMNRLVVPWQLVRLAVKAAESDSADRIADTNYGVAVPILIAELGRRAADLRSDLRRGQIKGVGILLKGIHDGMRTLRSEIDFSGHPDWGRQLPEIRKDVSRALTIKIDTVSGQVRRLLRPREAEDIAPNTVLDPHDVSETEDLLGFLETCRTYANELAVNEVTLRVHSELENYLDSRTPLLLDALRTAPGTDRAFRLSQIQAAIRFVGKVYGAGYAALLTRAAEVAGQAPAHKGAKQKAG